MSAIETLCAVCSAERRTENHHPAGRANCPEITVAVCVPCHRILTRWQEAAGIELRHDAPRTDLDRSRAILTGTAHVLALASHHAAPGDPAAAALRLFTRTCVAWLDGIAEPDRPGRWFPSSRRSAPLPDPAGLARSAVADALLARLLAETAAALLPVDSVTRRSVERLAEGMSDGRAGVILAQLGPEFVSAGIVIPQLARDAMASPGAAWDSVAHVEGMVRTLEEACSRTP